MAGPGLSSNVGVVLRALMHGPLIRFRTEMGGLIWPDFCFALIVTTACAA